MMRRISDVAFQSARRALFCSWTPSSSPSEYEAMTMSNLWSPVLRKVCHYSVLSCQVSKLCNNAGKSARIDNHCCTWKVSMSCRTCLQLLSEWALGLTSACLFDWQGQVLHASYHICLVCWATFLQRKALTLRILQSAISRKAVETKPDVWPLEDLRSLLLLPFLLSRSSWLRKPCSFGSHLIDDCRLTSMSSAASDPAEIGLGRAENFHSRLGQRHAAWQQQSANKIVRQKTMIMLWNVDDQVSKSILNAGRSRHCTWRFSLIVIRIRDCSSCICMALNFTAHPSHWWRGLNSMHALQFSWPHLHSQLVSALVNNLAWWRFTSCNFVL